MQIFEYEWVNERKQRILKSMIKDRLTEDTNKIYARNTTVKEIDSQKSREFLEQYHLQGYANAEISIGLYYNNELVGLMSFGIPRFIGGYQYELIRLCYRNNETVIGGSEKMFSYFLDKYEPESIITYSDFSKFNGKVYSRLGMRYIGVTEPGYMWVDTRTNEALTRYQTTKQKLTEKNIGNLGETENNIMYALGYLKVYNSGNLKFEYRKEYKNA